MRPLPVFLPSGRLSRAVVPYNAADEVTKAPEVWGCRTPERILGAITTGVVVTLRRAFACPCAPGVAPIVTALSPGCVP